MGLDTVEILIAWESAFGIRIEDREAEQIRTPRMAIDLICRKLNVDQTATGPCLSARAFYKLRQSVTTVCGSPRCTIRPKSSLRPLFSGTEGNIRWQAVGEHMGTRNWPRLRILGIPAGPGTCGEMSDWLATFEAHCLFNKGEPWTRTQVRQVVRSIVTETVGIKEFSDDDDFIHDLRLD